MRYIILAKGQHKGFNIPRQLSIINNERLLDRTIRLLRENGIKDIIVTGEYTDINAKVINPVNSYNYNTNTGYWLDAFNGLLDKETCFIWGDVYFSEQAIKTIVNTDTDSTLFFCTYKNNSKEYIKKWDEPLGYKVKDTKLFKKHIDIVKDMYDKGLTDRNPIVWELYRSINGINVNEHKLKDNVIIINDISCDIDTQEDIYKLNNIIGGKQMVRLEVIENFNLNEKMFNELKEITRANAENNEAGKMYLKDTFLTNEVIAKYLLNEADKEGNKGNNPANKVLVKLIEVIPEKVEKPVKKTRTKKVK